MRYSGSRWLMLKGRQRTRTTIMAPLAANLDDTEDVSLNFEDDASMEKKSKFRHPIAAFFHLLFRVLAIVAYLICGLFSDSFITSFVIIVLLLSFDFWTVKNITGRILVGLRWWNYVDEDGNSKWIFESRKKKSGKKLNATESRLFWLGLIICPIIWAFLLVAAIFSLKIKWLLIVLVGLTLNSANLIGYIKCKKDAKKQVKDLAGNASSFLGRQLLSQMLGRNSKSQPEAT
ncbi:Golgi apparatus membrane protein TVP23 homolog B-like [Rhopilema esculentum]|uniref:Golgi apparatus membrane protein TVP23 homolog B-like n=1 Tax=Rhopilema esculentum TaxID=499914 RepID=UPI0031DCE064